MPSTMEENKARRVNEECWGQEGGYCYCVEVEKISLMT